MYSKIELVVFDIAGTTVQDNGEIAVAFQEALQSFGYVVPVEKINPLMGYKKTEAIERMLKEYETSKEKITPVFIQDIHKCFVKNMVDYYAVAGNVKPLPYAEEVFAYFKRINIKIGLNTGFPKEITDVIIDRLDRKSVV